MSTRQCLSALLLGMCPTILLAQQTQVRPDPAATAASSAQTAKAASPSASAATSAESTQLLDAVMVTANRRLQRSIDVPSGVTVLEGTTLRDRGLDKFEDYVAAIPGLTYSSSGGGRGDLYMRGVSSPGVGRSTVGLYLDEIPMSFGGFEPDNNTYDLARIEALKGPQGTLYGEGSLGGAIKLVTRKPDLRAFSASTSLTGYLTTGGDPGGNVRAMINVPVVVDRFALRLVATSERVGGWIDNPLLDQKNVNSSRNDGVRLMGAAALTTDSNLLLTYVGQRNTVDAQSNTDYGATTFTQNRRSLSSSKERTNIYNLTYNLTTSAGTMTVSASNVERTLDEIIDLKPTSDAIGAAIGIPDLNFINNQNLDFKISSQEIRWVSPDTGDFTYVLGAFHKVRKEPYTFVVPNVPQTAAIFPDPVASADVQSKDSEVAVFGESVYNLRRDLHLTTGIRFSREKNDASADIFSATSGPVPTVNGEATHNSTTPRLSLGYDISATQNLYATVSKGYRSGGANYQIDTSQGDPLLYRPDTAINYEIGTKAALLDGTVVAELALFQLDWKDVQTSYTSPDALRSYTFNGGKARTRGAELGVLARATRTLDLNATLSLLRAKYTEAIPLVGVESGADLPFSPKTTASVAATYRFPVGDSLGGSVTGEVQHVGRRLSSDRVDLDGYTIANIRAGLKLSKVTLTAYVKNVGNRFVVLDTQVGNGYQRVLQARTGGLTADFEF